MNRLPLVTASHAPRPGSTDGEASNPGPQLLKRGRRSVFATDKRNSALATDRDLREDTLRVWHCNVQGLQPRIPEIVATLRDMPQKPDLLCLNETWLDATTEQVEIEGYSVVARRDRSKKANRGGVMILALHQVADRVVPILSSAKSERIWAAVHTDQGQVAVCAWYRPPGSGCASVESLVAEIAEVRQTAAHLLVVGDLNVYNKKWLRFSPEDRAEGKRMQAVAQEAGLKQLVRAPTHGRYLLDLALSDTPDSKATVLPEIADHGAVLVTTKMTVPKSQAQQRTVWLYETADWEAMEDDLLHHDWSAMDEKDADAAAEYMTTTLMMNAERLIEKKTIRFRKSTHPWVNERVREAVRAKQLAQTREESRAAAAECSSVIRSERERWTSRVQEEMRSLPSSSKLWWTKNRQLLQLKQPQCSIPALKAADASWHTDAGEKAHMLAAHFHKKCRLPAAETNRFTVIAGHHPPEIDSPACSDSTKAEASRKFVAASVIAAATRILSQLDADSASGPDRVAARVLKRCAQPLAVPMAKLAEQIVAEGRWPEAWALHWVVPLHKKKETFLCNNYRGIHLTSQLSKAMERLLGERWTPEAASDRSAGENQFAYRKKRGSRDLLAHASMQWIMALRMKQKVAVYLSDVSGAFDKVEAQRLMQKLEASDVDPKMLPVIRSWLRARRAKVVVGGAQADMPDLENQVFQGTVWGPILWLVFYADSSEAVRENGFHELIFADDLNAFKTFGHKVGKEEILAEAATCQSNLHAWGRANQVAFDRGKEATAILSRWPGQTHGEDFTILGTVFDGMLTMRPAVDEILKSVRWRKHVLQRSRRYHSLSQMVLLWKSRVLGSIEHRTSAIYHAADTILQPLDRLQASYLEALGLSELDALRDHNLAPLSCRRDMAMLGVIHRALLGQGPAHFREHICLATDADAALAATLPRHRLQAKSYRKGLAIDFEAPSCRSEPPDFFLRSIFGLLDVYNLLPVAVVEQSSDVRSFQARLQAMLCCASSSGFSRWQGLFSPRWDMRHHPLCAWRAQSPVLQGV